MGTKSIPSGWTFRGAIEGVYGNGLAYIETADDYPVYKDVVVLDTTDAGVLFDPGPHKGRVIFLPWHRILSIRFDKIPASEQ